MRHQLAYGLVIGCLAGCSQDDEAASGDGPVGNSGVGISGDGDSASENGDPEGSTNTDSMSGGDGDASGPGNDGNDGSTGGTTNGDGDGPVTPSPSTCGDTELTDWEQMMLDKHNEWRASVEPAAQDMYRLYWDTNIAANAAAWVSSCDPDWPHSPEDDRMGVGGYQVLGENLSYCAGTGCSELPDVQDGSGEGDAEGWWEERLDYDYSANESTGGVISHYLAMASSDVYAIGCATQKCPAPGPYGWDGEWWWTICQYGPRGRGYWVDERPYDEGPGGLVEPAASLLDQHPGICRE